MSFSSVIKLNDVDDYIAPTKTCIKPVKINKQVGKTKSIVIEQDGSYTAVTEKGELYKLEKASITLNDCLACSGCITTAESVLISEHSTQTFLDVLRLNHSEQRNHERTVVVSLSPQSVVSLAVEVTIGDTKVGKCYEHWRTHNFATVADLSTLECVWYFIAQRLYSMGADFVLDSTWFRDVALFESAREFIHSFRAVHSDSNAIRLPIFCGTCPGWVCYAEKAHSGVDGARGSASQCAEEKFSIVPHLSKVRSPQQITGSILKQLWERRQSLYHVSIMPCFDKKLEASRAEFSTSIASVDDNGTQMIRDVDLVLATKEFLQILEEFDPQHNDIAMHSVSNVHPENSDPDADLLRILDRFNHLDFKEGPSLYRHAGSGSGGYAMFVFVQAAKELFSIHLPFDDPTSDNRVHARTLQNSDIQELLLFNSDEECNTAREMLTNLPSSRTPYRSIKSTQMPTSLLAFAVANGFRNIQNLVQSLKNTYKLKSGSLLAGKSQIRHSVHYPFDYVEIMACPGGCLNGGGQLKGTYKEASEFYFKLPSVAPMTTSVAQQLRNFVDRIDPEHRCLYTQYRDVPKIEIVNPSALQW